MRRRVVVTGAGAISPVATSAAGLHEALCEGRSGLKPIELFETDGITGLGPRLAGEIRPFEPREWLGDRNLRPVDRTARLLLAAAQQALDAAGWAPELRTGRQAGLVIGTMYCSVRTIAEFDRRAVQLGPSYASPLDFANSVINAAAGQAAIWHGLPGVNSTISAGEASGLLSLATAADLIRTGRAEALLAGGVEELCFESFIGHLRAGRLAPAGTVGDTGRPVPFDARRDGAALGEGAALVALEEAGMADLRGATVLAEVLGHGSAFDPGGGTGRAEALARAIRQALDDAGLGPADVDAVSTGASGGVNEDRQEALGIAAALGDHAAMMPVTAVKSMLGEALGASGALQAVAALGTLADGILPGVLNLSEMDEGLPLNGVLSASRPIRARQVLITVCGSGGHCCALILGAA
ncbi:MAG: beta-ketoacyl synthase N-terminal-like domain-containing protein [Acidobacteriota bacterium]